MTENVNASAIAWKHKYDVLQGKYNAETRNLRQALMHRDSTNRALRVEAANLAIQTKQAQARAGRWKRTAGYTAFGTCGMALAALVMFLLLMQHKDPPPCPATTPEVEGERYDAAPETIEAPPAQPAVEV